jgi:hypothetical protein
MAHDYHERFRQFLLSSAQEQARPFDASNLEFDQKFRPVAESAWRRIVLIRRQGQRCLFLILLHSDNLFQRSLVWRFTIGENSTWQQEEP